MRLKGKKIAVLLEGDFYEHEIWYYHFRFPEEGAELHFLTRLWGQSSLTFKGHEYHAPFVPGGPPRDMSMSPLHPARCLQDSQVHLRFHGPVLPGAKRGCPGAHARRGAAARALGGR